MISFSKEEKQKYSLHFNIHFDCLGVAAVMYATAMDEVLGSISRSD